MSTTTAIPLRFPGMLPHEGLLLHRWLELHASEYDSFDYNVRIGAGYDPGPTWPETTRRMAIMNSQLRTDAVARKGNQVTLIEVKYLAGPSAVGQLLTYDAIWAGDFPSEPLPKLILVAYRFKPNIQPLLDKARIRLDLIDVDFGNLPRPPYFFPFP